MTNKISGILGLKRTAITLGSLFLLLVLNLPCFSQQREVPGESAPGGVSPTVGHTTVQATIQPTQAARDRDEYRLIFPSSFDLPARPISADRDSSRASKFDNFVARLNDAGSDGYRLTSFVYDGSGLPVAIVKRDGGNFEYKWLSTDGSTGGSQVTVDFDRKYPELSDKGFRLADYSTFENACDYPAAHSSDPGPLVQECHDAYVFLFEREKIATRPAAHGHAGLRGSDAIFLSEIKQLLAKGLVPKHILPSYRFWFEPAAVSDRRWGGADVEIASEAVDAGTWRRSTFKKRINQLGQRGYRAAMIDWGLALMHRQPGDVAKYAYKWLKADESLAKNLTLLEANGALYLTTYKQNQLVFEQRLGHDPRRHSYRTLSFDFRLAKDVSKGLVQVRITPFSEETIRILQALAGEGFMVRDLFRSGKHFTAILERPH